MIFILLEAYFIAHEYIKIHNTYIIAIAEVCYRSYFQLASILRHQDGACYGCTYRFLGECLQLQINHLRRTLYPDFGDAGHSSSQVCSGGEESERHCNFKM